MFEHDINWNSLGPLTPDENMHQPKMALIGFVSLNTVQSKTALKLKQLENYILARQYISMHLVYNSLNYLKFSRETINLQFC